MTFDEMLKTRGGSMKWIALVALLGCGDSDASRQVCNQAAEQSVAVTNSLARLDKKLSQFTIQPECSVCPPVRTCPNDTQALAKGDEALREMEQLRDLVKRYKDDGSFSTIDLIQQIDDLTGEH